MEEKGGNETRQSERDSYLIAENRPTRKKKQTSRWYRYFANEMCSLPMQIWFIFRVKEHSKKKFQNLFHLATMWVLRKNPCSQSPFTVEQLVGFLLNSFRQYEPIKYRMFNCVHYQIYPNTWCSGNEISYHSVSNFRHALRLALIWSWSMQNNA